MSVKIIVVLFVVMHHTSLTVGNMFVTSGSDITIPCTSNTYNFPSWSGPEIVNGRYLQYNDRGKNNFNNLIPTQKRQRLSWANDFKSLVIKNVTVADEGPYQCINETSTNVTNMVVRVEPSPPVIRQVSVVSAGSVVQINCTSYGSKPAANITWSYRNRDVEGEQNILVDEATNTSTVISLLRLPVTADDNGINVTCIVSHPLLTSKVSTNLKVLFPVRNSSTTITGNKKIIATGANPLTLNCTTGSSNPVSDIKWFNGSVEMENKQPVRTWIGENNGEVRSQNLVMYPTRDMDGDEITCSVNNSENRKTSVNDSVVLDLQYSPLVKINGQREFMLTEGDTVQLNCKVDSKPISNIKWFHDNTLLSQRTPAADNVHNLTINTVNRTHYGKYFCKATNNIGSENQDQVSIGVKFKPISVSISGNKNIIANGITQLRLLCTSGSSNPVSEITWKINDEVKPATKLLANQNGDFGGIIRQTELSLTPNRGNDGDIVSCEAKNSLGTSETSEETLDLQYGPIIKTMSNVTTVEGSRVELKCSASSKPPSTFKWLKGGQTIHEGTGVVGSNSLVYIINQVRRGDAALYTCNANNGVESQDNSNVLLTVQYPPDVTVVGSNTSVISPSITLTCNAKGVPDKNYRYGRWIQTWPGHHVPVSEHPGSETLRLTGLTYQHSGVYTCSASNGVRKFGTAQEFNEGSTQILIKSFPIITKFSEKITAKLNERLNVSMEYYSNTGASDVVLYKKVNNFRQKVPGYSLYKTSTVIDLPVFSNIVKTTGTKVTFSFTILSKEHMGYYDIIVSNEVDSKIQTLEVIPKGPPSVPYNITVDHIQQTSARVSWQQGYHGGFDQTFLIQLSTDRTNWENVETVFGGKDESKEPKYKTVSGLKHSSAYFVRIYSFNIEGTSPFSQYQNFTTFTVTESSASSPPVGGIVGGTVSALVVIGLVVVIVVLVRRKKITKEGIRSQFHTVFSHIRRQNQQEAQTDAHVHDGTYEDSTKSKITKPKAKQNEINLYEKLQCSSGNENTKPYDIIQVVKETPVDSKAIYENLPKKVCTTEAFKSEIAEKLNKGKPRIYENMKPGVKATKRSK